MNKAEDIEKLRDYIVEQENKLERLTNTIRVAQQTRYLKSLRKQLKELEHEQA